MTSLPVLVKKPEGKYCVGVDIAMEGGKEIMTFCVIEKDENENTLIRQIEAVKNEKVGDYRDQVERLEEFYNTKVLIEKR